MTEKTICQQAAEYSNKMTAEEFFHYPEVIKYFSDCIYMIGNTYGFHLNANIAFKWDQEGPVGCTDGNYTHIYPLHHFFEKLDLESHVEVALGVAAHEVAHRLFTDFKELNDVNDSLKKQQLHNSPCLDNLSSELKLNLKEMESFMKDSNKAFALLSMFHEIQNTVEDGYIEDNFLKLYQGEMADALLRTREHQFYSGKTIDEISKAEWSQLAKTLSFLLSYAKYGTWLCDSLGELKNPQLKSVKKCLNLVDEYMKLSTSKDSSARKTEIIWLIIATIWDEIKPEIEKSAENSKMMEKIIDELRKALGSLGSVMPTGCSGSKHSESTEAEQCDNSSDDTDADPTGRKEASEALKKAISEGDAEGKTDSNSDGSQEDSDGSQNDKVEISDPTPSEKKQKPVSSNKCEKRLVRVIKEEAGRIDNSFDGAATAGTSGGIFKHNIKSSGYDAAAEDIKSLINTVSKNIVSSKMEAEATRVAQKAASAIKLNGLHQGYEFHINRITDHTSLEYLKELYNQVSPNLLKISKTLQKQMLKKLKKSQQGANLKGLYYGKKLNSSELYRVDGKIFSNKKIPSEKPPLSVGILIDESGSMAGSNRATSARASAIILEDFCRNLHIPCCIYGHTSGQRRNSVDMYSYVSFNNIDGADRYRLMDISARCGNRDGAALQFIGNEMQKRKEPNRIIILISDGQPADSGYGGQAAINDLKEIKRNLNRAGIPLFAAAIGADKENIHEIYGNGFMDISNLEDMPKILTGLVSKFCKF